MLGTISSFVPEKVKSRITYERTISSREIENSSKKVGGEELVLGDFWIPQK